MGQVEQHDGDTDGEINRAAKYCGKRGDKQQGRTDHTNEQRAANHGKSKGNGINQVAFGRRGGKEKTS